MPALGSFLGYLYYLIDKKHRKEIEARMELSICKTLTESSANLTQKFYKHFGIFCLELLKMPYLTQKDVSEIALIEPEIIQNLLLKGRGLIIVTGHFSNWEYAGLALSNTGFKINTVAKPIKQKSLDECLVQAREKYGQKILSQASALKGLLRGLKNNEVGIMLMDYDTSPDKGGIFVPFFDRPVSTLPTPAFLMKKTKAPIIVTRLRRLPDNSLEVQIGDIINFEDYSEEDDLIYAVTARIQKVYEEFILENPEQWLWLQRRWRFDPKEFS